MPTDNVANIDWKRTALDVIIVFLLTGVGGFVVGFTSAILHAPLSNLWLAISNLVFATGGFAYVARKTPENRWRHLFMVAIGIWLISLINVILKYSTVSEWMFSFGVILFFMGAGGGIGMLLGKTASKKSATPQP